MYTRFMQYNSFSNYVSRSRRILKNATQQLSKNRIAHTALTLSDQMGIENISMRKLASELDVTAMALYRYYASIEEIRAAAVALAYKEVDTHPIPGERWDDTLRRTTASIREMHLNHASAHLHLIETTGDSPALQAHTQAIYELHENQGIPPKTLQKAWRLVDAFLGGFLQGEIYDVINEHEKPEAATGDSWRETAAGAYSEETFHDGIDIIIAGIKALAAPDPCDWHTPENA